MGSSIETHNNLTVVVVSSIYTTMIDTKDCWLWAGYKNDLGYGQLFYRENNKSKYVYAHRLSYETSVGEIPEGLVIDHLCRVRCCINPSHLQAVTASVNTLRGEGVRVNTRKTHCPVGHEYTPANTLRYGKGWRRCRKCSNERHKKYYEENKDKWKSYNTKP